MSGMGGINAAKTTTNPREIREVYAKPFQAAVTEAKIGSVMNAIPVTTGCHRWKPGASDRSFAWGNEV